MNAKGIILNYSERWYRLAPTILDRWLKDISSIKDTNLLIQVMYFRVFECTHLFTRNWKLKDSERRRTVSAAQQYRDEKLTFEIFRCVYSCFKVFLKFAAWYWNHWLFNACELQKVMEYPALIVPSRYSYDLSLRREGGIQGQQLDFLYFFTVKTSTLDGIITFFRMKIYSYAL